MFPAGSAGTFTNIIDRYLVVCENAGIEPVIVVNKGDLLNVEQEQEVESQLQIYRDIGYQTIIISAETGKIWKN